MNRLTESKTGDLLRNSALKTDLNCKIYARLAAYEDTGLEPDACANYRKFEDEAISKNVTFKRIIELMNAEAEGRLIILPCKVGDTVYCSSYDEYGIAPIDKGTVYAVSINGRTNWFSALYKSGLRYDYTWDDLGKTVFLTYEEAEKALKEAQE